MTPFPVLQSTLSPAQLAIWVADNYPLTEVRCTIAKTNINHTYMVHAAERRAVLRVYAHNHRTETEIEEEARILQLLHRSGLGVAAMLPDKAGNYIHQLTAPEGLRYVSLFTYAEGSKVRFLSPELCERIGQFMGRFHHATMHERVQRTSYNMELLANKAITHIAALFPDAAEELAYLHHCSQTLAHVFGTTNEYRQGIVHLDIWYDNMSIDAEGLITLFDFDNLGNGPLILDLGYFCMQLFYIEPDKQVYEEKKAAFIKGYKSALPVDEAELALIPYAGLAIWIYYLGLQAERFDYSGNLFLSANYMKMYLGRSREWLLYNGISIAPGSDK
jgi:Ser/Thr protein kinase RdoA (MazF antagonist)